MARSKYFTELPPPPPPKTNVGPKGQNVPLRPPPKPAAPKPKPRGR